VRFLASVTCSALRLHPDSLGRFRIVLPSEPVTRFVIGDPFYGYYGFICRPSARNGHISAPLRGHCRSYNAPAQTALHRVRSKTVSLPAYLLYPLGYGEDIGLQHTAVPCPPSRPARGSHRV